jgi:hypothetical protein
MAKSKRHGYLLAGDKPMTAEHLARIFGQSLETTSELLVELAQAGVYSMDNDAIFSRRMVKEEGGRKSNRDRVLRWRNGHVMPMKQKSNAPCNGHVMGQRLEARGQKLERERGAQVRPALTDWVAYAKSIGWVGKDVQGAFDHYEANGWKVGGRAPVKNWQAAARNCFRRNQHTQPKGTQPMKPQIKSSCESAPLYRVMGFSSYADWQKAGFPS